jgi:aryl-alcohol dehydrogenase-like predicted oxidoreductase
MNRDPERNGVLKACEELGIGFVPWGPVGMGYLTGKIDQSTKLDPKTDFRSEFERFSAANLEANRPFVDLLRKFGEQKNATPAHVAIAWLLAQSPWIVPIPGTRNASHLTENLGAINVRFTPAELREFNAALSKLKVHGGRMHAKFMTEVETI